MTQVTLALMSQRGTRVSGKYTCAHCHHACVEAYRYDVANRLVYLCSDCKNRLLRRGHPPEGSTTPRLDGQKHAKKRRTKKKGKKKKKGTVNSEYRPRTDAMDYRVPGSYGTGKRR